MDEGVIEGGEDVGNTEDGLTLSDLGTEGDGVFFLLDFDFFGGLHKTSSKSQHRNPSIVNVFRLRKKDISSLIDILKGFGRFGRTILTELTRKA